MKIIEGNLALSDARFCIVATRFNERIVNSLVEGARDTLVRHGVDESDVHLVRVPGAYELPLAVRRVGQTRNYDGIVAVGAVIRGATPHFEYVCSECASGLSRVSMELDLPVGFGVLTVDTIEQAIERAGTKAGNKGAEAAMAAIEMVSLLRDLGD